MRYCLVMILIHTVAVVFFVSSCQKDSSSESCLSEYVDSLMQVSPDSALLVLNSIVHPEKLSKKDRADYAIIYSRVQDQLCIRQTSDSLIREAVKYYAGELNRQKEMEAYYYLGCANKDMRRMKLAVNAFLKSLEIMPAKSESIYLGAIYTKLAACYEDQDMYVEALDMYRKACKVYLELHDEKNLCNSYHGIAVVHHLCNQPDSSLLYYQKALSIAETYSDKRWPYLILSDMARIYYEKRDYRKAHWCISLSLAIAPSKDKLWSGHLLKGRILKSMHQADSARYYFNIAKTSPYIYSHAGSYYELYDLEKTEGDFSAAVAAVDSFLILSDSIQKTTNALEIERMRAKYEAGLLQRQLSSDYRIKLLSLVSICVLIILVFLLKDRRRKNKVIRLQGQINSLNAATLQKLSSGEDGESIPMESEKDTFEKHFKAKLELSLQLYRETDIYKKIRVIENDELRHKVHLNAGERQKTCEELYKNFSDLMTDLKLQCASLTKQDILYCIFLATGCSKYTILLCTSTSEGAFKTRKSRIKEKLGDELFKLLVDKERC